MLASLAVLRAGHAVESVSFSGVFGTVERAIFSLGAGCDSCSLDNMDGGWVCEAAVLALTASVIFYGLAERVLPLADVMGVLQAAVEGEDLSLIHI